MVKIDPLLNKITAAEKRTIHTYSVGCKPLIQSANVIVCYDRALEIDEKYANAYYNRACLKCKLNKINECLDDLKAAAKLDETVIELARKDVDFSSINDNQEFRLLVNR